ncbi:MAG TPA: hypothetical protein VES20_07605 [Bryobacteraceae bacterium]|nr:hypothetical protein [Bryobacteraceae bacterium]
MFHNKSVVSIQFPKVQASATPVRAAINIRFSDGTVVSLGLTISGEECTVEASDVAVRGNLDGAH